MRQKNGTGSTGWKKPIGDPRQCQPPTPARSYNGTNNIFFCVVPPTWPPRRQMLNFKLAAKNNANLCYVVRRDSTSSFI